ncbi:MAG: hypothetical protein E1N59_1625 [Puniceicoccaceae bacterium 5H]|nr:MAG: hypothetical protein E1N59_1625 [Puniceicoccaceae bacterium 5H]
MAEVPSMWRTELWHPLSVHLPVALLTVAGLLALVTPTLGRYVGGKGLKFSYSLLLWLGLATFWVAFYTGQMAYSIEVRRICDPGVLKEHLRWAYIAGAIFSSAAVFDLAQVLLKRRLHLILLGASYLCSFVGAFSLGYLGHLGAKLVYQQGAAVHQPSDDCAEFE